MSKRVKSYLLRGGDSFTYNMLFESLRHCSWERICIATSASLTISLSGSKAFAFDPTTVASGVGALAGLVSPVAGVDEAIDTGMALGDLLSELEVEPESEEDVKRAVRDLESLNSRMRELKGTEADVHSLLSEDLNQVKSLSAQLRAIKNMIQASKRIAEILGLRPKAGAVAAQVQQMKINSMIVDELQAIRRHLVLSSIRDRKAQLRRSYLLESIAETERRTR